MMWPTDRQSQGWNGPVVDEPDSAKPYVPVLSNFERRAYQAAHRILDRPLADRARAAPGGFNRSVVDQVARIIMEEFDVEPEP